MANNYLIKIAKDYKEAVFKQNDCLKNMISALTIRYKDHLYIPNIDINDVSVNFFIGHILENTLDASTILLVYSRIPVNGDGIKTDTLFDRVLTKENIEEALKEKGLE